jgi:hypothetical protein
VKERRGEERGGEEQRAWGRGGEGAHVSKIANNKQARRTGLVSALPEAAAHSPGAVHGGATQRHVHTRPVHRNLSTRFPGLFGLLG